MTFLAKQFSRRNVDRQVFLFIKELGFTDLQAQVAAGRANGKNDNIETGKILLPALANLHHPKLLKDGEKAASLIVKAITQNSMIGFLTDYDVDGICSHMVLLESMRIFSVQQAKLMSFIGHRMEDGYGVSENLVDRILAGEKKPHLIITADCGSSDEKQIQRLKKAGIEVVVTDHHAIPEEGVPESAMATVNPSRPDCPFPDKAVSGCMVAWMLMCLVRNRLIDNGYLDEKTHKLGELLDYVGLSTVADAVSFFSSTNRAVVGKGLDIINEQRKYPWSIFAQKIANGSSKKITTEDLAFQVAPRINARSRMADPYAALNFFMAATQVDAVKYLGKLEKSNEKRKSTEQMMLKKALAQALQINNRSKKSLVVFDEIFHAGVQGIVASRIVDTFGKPTVVASPVGDENMVSGSARSIDSVDIRHVLQKIHEKYPDIFIGFGGHKGAAGIKIRKEDLQNFSRAFEEMVHEQVGAVDLCPQIFTDGSLKTENINSATIEELQKLQPFGRGFEEPVFDGEFYVASSRLVGAEPVHLSLQLRSEGVEFKAIWFRALLKAGDEPPVKKGNTIRCAYRLKTNFFRGKESLQLMLDYAEPVLTYN